jgi:hypothetical protein
MYPALEEALSRTTFRNLVGLYESAHIGTQGKTRAEEETASRIRRAFNQWGKRPASDPTGLFDDLSAFGLSVSSGPSKHATAAVLSFALMACNTGMELDEASRRLGGLSRLCRGATQALLFDMAKRIETLGAPADSALLARLQKALEAVRASRAIAHD